MALRFLHLAALLCGGWSRNSLTSSHSAAARSVFAWPSELAAAGVVAAMLRNACFMLLVGLVLLEPYSPPGCRGAARTLLFGLKPMDPLTLSRWRRSVLPAVVTLAASHHRCAANVNPIVSSRRETNGALMFPRKPPCPVECHVE